MSVRPSCLAVLALLLAAAPAFAYVETTDLDWVTAPVLDRLAQRLGPLAANRDRSASEEREFRALSKVYSRLSGPSERLADEFRELEAAATGLRGVQDDAGSLGAALTTATDRAEEQLVLRRGTVDDYVVRLPDAFARRRISDRLFAADKLVAKAASKQRAERRAPLLRRAEKLLTAALVAADLEAERFDIERPAPRVRNGSLVGSAGGRVVIPDDGSALAGVDVTVQPGTVGSTVRLLVQEIPWTWTWPEAPVAPVLQIGEVLSPVPAELPRPLRVSFRYDAAHAGDPTLAVTPGWSGAPALPGAEFGSDGRVSVEVPSFGVVAARRILPTPPHPDFPAETYHVVLAFGRATSGTASTAESADAVAELDLTFGPGPTGSASAGTLAAVERRYVEGPPRHEDESRAATLPGGSLEWSLVRTGPVYLPGSYGISLPLEGETLTGSGVLSRDGALTVFTARGPETVAIGFGIRDDATASATDLGKPWFVGVQGVRFDGAGAADFSERRTVGIAGLAPDGAGGLAAIQGESVFTRTVRVRGDVFPAEFSDTSSTAAPDGIAAVSVGADGRLVADGGRTTGWVHSRAGILVARTFDPPSASLALLLGVRDDGGDYEDLFAAGSPAPSGLAPTYATRTVLAGAGIASPGTSGARVSAGRQTTWMAWGRYQPSVYAPVWSDLTYSFAWTIDWTTLEVGEDDASPQWRAVARVGSGSGYPHAIEDGFDHTGTPGPSPRRGSDASLGVSVVVSPDGEAILVHSHGSVGLGIRVRD